MERQKEIWKLALKDMVYTTKPQTLDKIGDAINSNLDFMLLCVTEGDILKMYSFKEYNTTKIVFLSHFF